MNDFSNIELICLGLSVPCLLGLFVQVGKNNDAVKKYCYTGKVKIVFLLLFLIGLYVYSCYKYDYSESLFGHFIALVMIYLVFINYISLSTVYYLGSNYIEKTGLVKSFKIDFSKIVKISERKLGADYLITLFDGANSIVFNSKLTNFDELKDNLIENCDTAEISLQNPSTSAPNTPKK